MDNSWIYGLSKIVHSVEVWISVARGYYPYIYIYIFAYLQLYPSSTDLWLEWSLASSRVGLSGAWAKGSGCLSQGIAGPCDSVEKCGLIIYLIVYIYIYMYMYMYVCVCMCMCMCIYIYAYVYKKDKAFWLQKELCICDEFKFTHKSTQQFSICRWGFILRICSGQVGKQTGDVHHFFPWLDHHGSRLSLIDHGSLNGLWLPARDFFSNNRTGYLPTEVGQDLPSPSGSEHAAVSWDFPARGKRGK